MSHENDTRGEDPTRLESTVAGSPTAGAGPIGPYRLRQKLGEGGMGEVWAAEQESPVRRTVALKVIKPGMDTKQVVARFESERQALAMMDHPAIAKVFDAGATPGGRPYFAMELVSGVPITDHCDRQRLSTRERLELFIQVCEGVQHAHQKAIIHRDIKPSNVLVAIQENRAVPKIIDFGVAKAVSRKLTDTTMYTELGVMIGTPEYMSPEQAEMSGQGVDTRTDVYALGVLLYELLTGTLPFESRKLRSGGFDEIRRIIREDEPLRPSTRMTTLGDEGAGRAELRRTDLTGLRRQLSGDLDWITMKALEKDRTRRYGSPGELADDIRLHLEHLPVRAGPPGAAYRIRKFVRRHRLGVSIASGLVLLLAAFAVTMAVQARRIASERDRANREAETARSALGFVTGLFEVSDPGEARGNSVTAREILDRGVDEIERTLSDQPEVYARLSATMGTVYRSLGLYAPAERLFRNALKARRDALGPLNPATLESANELGVLLQAQGRLSEAEPYYREALAGRRASLGDDHPDTLESLNDMGHLLRAQGNFDAAEDFYRQALAGKRRILGNEHPETLTSIDNVGLVLKAQGRLEEAETFYREALQGRRAVLGDDHPDTLVSIANLGSALQAAGKLAEAEPYYREALDGFRRVLGEDHPRTLVAFNNMGFLLESQGKLAEAEPYYRDGLSRFLRVLGEDHPNTAVIMSNLGDLYTKLGRFDEAEPHVSRALEIAERVLPAGHVTIGNILRKQGRCLTGLGRFAEAEAALLRAHELLRTAVGEQHTATLEASADLAALYEAWGRPDEARRWTR